MRLSLTDPQRRALETAAAAEKRVRGWQRYRAVLLRAEGRTVSAVAHTLECSEAIVYGSSAEWRRAGRPRSPRRIAGHRARGTLLHDAGQRRD